MVAVVVRSVLAGGYRDSLNARTTPAVPIVWEPATASSSSAACSRLTTVQVDPNLAESM